MKTYTTKHFAKSRFTSLADDTRAKRFFSANYTEIKYTVVGYRFLKEIYDRGNDLSEDRVFKSVFGQFYAMAPLFVTNNFISKFYNKMNEIRRSKKTSNLDPSAIATELCKDDSRYQFSFVTKMLNLENDRLYPIYDSKVALMLGFNTNVLSGKSHEIKAAQYNSWYKAIIEIYNELLLDEKAKTVLANFKKTFDCEDLSDMRIIDIIFWQLGKDEEKRDQKHYKIMEINKILEDNTTKKQKILNLKKLGLTRTEIIELDFVDQVSVYDIFREEKNKTEEK